MQTIIDYIMLNYIWIIAGSIIILLAVIGYYADKTNFGQGKNKTEEAKDNIDIKTLEGKRMEDLFEPNMESQNSVQNDMAFNNIENSVKSYNVTQTHSTKDELNENKQNTNDVDNNIEELIKTEEEFEQFEKEFNELLPQKELVDDELLDEIDNLSLDKTQKLNISDIPDLDDIDLPEIKSLSIEDEDIWRF